MNVSRHAVLPYNPGMERGTPEKMRGAVLTGPRRIRVVSMPVPVPRRGEVLVRVRAVGICRSDIHYYLDGRIGNQVIRKWPQALGHEASGEAWKIGPGVRGFRVGDRVAIEPASPCGHCRHCREGRGNICPRTGFLGMPGQAGALAEFLAVRSGGLVKLPRGISFEEGVALEPMAIGMHAVALTRAGIREAAVVGAGPIGLSVLAALGSRRARTTAFDYLPCRLRVARRIGADSVVRVPRGVKMGHVAGRAGRKWDFVFEAGGTEEAIDLALELASPGGTVALIGINRGLQTGINLHTARRKELVLLNVRRSNDELGECVRLLGRGKLRLKETISHIGRLKDADRFFRLVSGYRDGVVKAVITP